MGGYVNVLSVYGDGTAEVPMNEVVFRYLHVKGINGRKMWSTWDVMHDLLAAGSIEVDKIITHRMSIDAFDRAVPFAMEGNCGKVVLDF